MPSLQPDEQAVRQQLAQVLGSAGFSRNERLSRFLRFVVERHLNGKDNELKESVIAIEVFGRRPDFDSRFDAVVRTEAARLRAREASIQAQERRDRIDGGGYTAKEKARTEKRLDNTSKAIYKQKHDAQTKK